MIAVLVVAAPSSHAQTVRDVADILARGLEAEHRQDGRALLEQALALNAFGAHPDGGDDLAKAWLREAAALGVKPDDSQVWRGRTLGPAYKSGRVDARSHFTTRQSFNAGQTADIAVVTSDGRALGLTVLDDGRHEVCALAPSTSDLGCTWVPSFTSNSEITLDNESDEPVSFYLILN